MYTVITSTGLNRTFATVDQIGAALGQHVHDMATDAPTSWRIVTPHGREHPGFVQLPERRDDRLIADVVAVVLDDLRQPPASPTVRNPQATTPSKPGQPSLDPGSQVGGRSASSDVATRRNRRAGLRRTRHRRLKAPLRP